MSLFTSLPEDIIIDCVSRVPKCYYPTLSLVSKLFRSLIASPELYARRAVMDRTECFLYVTISLFDNIDRHNQKTNLYTLNRKPSSNGTDHSYTLVPVTSLPHTPTLGSYIAVDSKIFVMGGFSDSNTSSGNNAVLIDCRYHTARNLPNMPKDVAIPISYLVNEKIYVIGETHSGSDLFSLMVFDINTETWESRMRLDIGMYRRENPTWRNVYKTYTSRKSAVTWDNKVYFSQFFYDPKEDKWEKDELLNSSSLAWWYGYGCVMEGVLYCYCRTTDMLYAYDLKERFGKVVEGVDKFMHGGYYEGCEWPRTAIYGKKVVVFFDVEIVGEKTEIWCAVIKVEKDQEGEFCGKVEWCGCVLDNGLWAHVTDCLPIKV